MIEIRILQPGDEAALEAFLLPRVESSMFLVGNMRQSGLEYRGAPYEGTYAAALEDGQILGVAAHYWNGALVLQAPAHLASLSRAAVDASQRLVHGVLGPASQVSAVVTSLGLKEAPIQMDETEYLYRLDLQELIVPKSLQTGRCRGRPVEPGDLDLVTEWRVAYGVEALGGTDTPAWRQEARVDLERAMAEGRLWILEDAGEPVSTTAFNTTIQEAVQVGGVWTPPALRSRGYGRCAVAASLLDARAEGVGMAILFTGESNLPARKAYEALGFVRIGDYRLLLFKDGVAAGT